MYRQLLDGSARRQRAGLAVDDRRAATGKPYGFSRWQVEKRAPELCQRLRAAAARARSRTGRDGAAGARGPSRRVLLRRDPDPVGPAGPAEPQVAGDAGGVWLTAESLGDADPALAAHPDLPVVFVFDEPLLARLRLSGHRLVFLAEALADLSERRKVEVHRGEPVEVLGRATAGRDLCAGAGVRRPRGAALDVAALHPWPWLRRPAGGSVASFTAWAQQKGKES